MSDLAWSDMVEERGPDYASRATVLQLREALNGDVPHMLIAMRAGTTLAVIMAIADGEIDQVSIHLANTIKRCIKEVEVEREFARANRAFIAEGVELVLNPIRKRAAKNEQLLRDARWFSCFAILGAVAAGALLASFVTPPVIIPAALIAVAFVGVLGYYQILRRGGEIRGPKSSA